MTVNKILAGSQLPQNKFLEVFKINDNIPGYWNISDELIQLF